MAIWTRLPNDAAPRTRVYAADYRDWRDRTSVFEDAALGNAPQNFNLIGSGEPERLLAGRLSSGLLPVLRVAPALGRGFTAHEEQIGRDRVVILGDGLWRRRFAADPAIVGRTINLSGKPYEVVGVMGPDFQFPGREHQLWIPLTIDPRELTRQVTNYNQQAIARLKPGVGMEQAQREFDAHRRPARRRPSGHQSRRAFRGALAARGVGRPGPAGSVRDAGRGLLPAADRVLQPGGPARHPRREPQARVHRPRRARRLARAARAAGDGRGRTGARARRHRRHRRREIRGGGVRADRSGGAAAGRRDRHQRASARLLGAGAPAHGHHRRVAAGGPRLAGEHADGREGHEVVNRQPRRVAERATRWWSRSSRSRCRCWSGRRRWSGRSRR